MQYKGFTLDSFQEDSIASIEKNNSVVVSAPTGSGKTLIADYIINKYVRRGIKVIYTAPIKALSNQKYKEFSEEYGEENVGLMTGDIVKNPKAPVVIMTTEIYRNMAITKDEALYDISYVIFDEIHYINDIERGYVWEESIIFSKPEIRFLCLSATIPNAKEFASWIQAIKKHPVDVVRYEKRPVPLHKKFYDSELGITTLEKIKNSKDIPEFYKEQRGRRKKRVRRQRIIAPSHINLIKEVIAKKQIPCFFFTFSREKCQEHAFELMKEKVFSPNPEITTYTRRKLKDSPSEINILKSVKMLRQTLPYGIAFHHAGMIPIIKELVEELFSKGLIKVLYTTETFAVGINMPAKTVCFDGLRKYDGISFRFLNSKEYFQIAGRAGRRGIDKEGFVYSMLDRRDFDYLKLKEFTTKDIVPIHSQFKLSINTVLNLVKRHPEDERKLILSQNFFTFQKYGMDFERKQGMIYYSFNRIKKNLEKMGFIKDDKLTEKGEFSSKIYSDEIQMGEIFGTDFYKKLNEYQMLLILAALSYEPRKRTRFYKQFHSKDINELKSLINHNQQLAKEKRFNYLEKITALAHPAYHGQTIFDLIDYTNFLEGDILRFFRQINDRIGQLKDATHDKQLKDRLDSVMNVILDALKDVDSV